MTQEEFDSLKQEVGSFQLQVLPRLQALEQAIAQFQQSHTGLERLASLEERIKTLEEARERQKILNSKFIEKDSINPPYKPHETHKGTEPLTIFSWLKKKK